ncbi:MAG: VCBS repeat-containing protein [Elusimicrobia bacterium]|nr:VCBS repeat-containing protein [Elusimicrobiota bacterium]
MSADFDGDEFIDFAVVADGSMVDQSYNGGGLGNLRMGDFFFGRYPAWGLDGFPDPSPNLQLGLQADPWNIIFPVAGMQKTGDLAIFANLVVGPPPRTFGHFRLHHVTPSNIYGAQEMAVGPLDAGPYDLPDIVVWTGLGGFPAGGALPFPPNFARSSVVIYRNNGAFNFTENILIQRETFGGASTDCDRPEAGTLADMDGDADLDIVVACHTLVAGQKSLFYYRNNAGSFDWNPPNGVTDSPVPLEAPFGFPVTDPNIRKVVGADIDQDGRTDIVFGRENAIGVSLFCLRKNGPVSYQRFQIGPNNNFIVRAIAVGSLAGDRPLDVVAGGGAASPLTLFVPNIFNLAARWRAVQLPGGNLLTSEIGDVKIADVNNDNLLDIVAVAGQNSASGAAKAKGWDSHVMVWIQLVDANGVPGPEDWQPMGLMEPLYGDEGTAAFPGPAWGGVAIDDFDNDSDNDIVRVTKHWPLVYFENTWNTVQKVQIRATTADGQRGSVVFHSTHPAGQFRAADGMDWGNR